MVNLGKAFDLILNSCGDKIECWVGKTGFE